jgi:RNA polymerase sigma factor (sigma-70 family)
MSRLTQCNDEQLIELFLDGASDEARSAFEALVKRYHPAVMRVCRRVLNQREDAEDAAQATLAVLSRSAGKIRNRRSLGPWLYAIAHRIAVRMKALSARRRELHKRACGNVSRRPTEDAAIFGELRQILHDEVDHLPDDFRALVVHCYLGGKSNVEMAQFLGCPVGTVKGRLWRARAMLRQRLSRRLGGAVEVFA